MLEQGCPGGGAELSPDRSAVDGNVLQDEGGGRCGHGQDPVGAADLAAPYVDRGYDDSVRSEAVHEEADGGHIGDGVHGSDLMEVDLVDRGSVGVALGLGDEAVDRHDVVCDPLGDVHMAADDVLDVVDAAVMMVGMFMIVLVAVIMVMGVLVILVASAAVLAELVVMVVMLVNVVLTVVMLMLVIFTMVVLVRMVLMIFSMLMIMMFMIVMMVQALFLFAAHGDLHVGPGDAAFNGRLGLEDYARYAETVELVYKSLRIGQKLQKGGGQHVAGGSHAAVKE